MRRRSQCHYVRVQCVPTAYSAMLRGVYDEGHIYEYVLIGEKGGWHFLRYFLFLFSLECVQVYRSSVLLAVSSFFPIFFSEMHLYVKENCKAWMISEKCLNGVSFTLRCVCDVLLLYVDTVVLRYFAVMISVLFNFNGLSALYCFDFVLWYVTVSHVSVTLLCCMDVVTCILCLCFFASDKYDTKEIISLETRQDVIREVLQYFFTVSHKPELEGEIKKGINTWYVLKFVITVFSCFSCSFVCRIASIYYSLLGFKFLTAIRNLSTMIWEGEMCNYCYLLYSLAVLDYLVSFGAMLCW